MKYSFIIIFLIILGLLFALGIYYKKGVEQATADLENTLLDTAWIQLDASGNDTDEEIDFRKTKYNDPNHKFYDYQEYLHHRPGESGYWKLDGNTLIVIGYPSDVPPIVYTSVSIAGDLLSVTDSSEGAEIKFRKILKSSESFSSEFLQGEWIVTGIKVSSSGVQARRENDPEFMGRKFIVTENSISFGGEHCLSPRLAPTRIPATKWFADTFGHSPQDFGMETQPDRSLDAIMIACSSGNIGPEATGNSSIIRLPDDQIGLSYFDATLLILNRVSR